MVDALEGGPVALEGASHGEARSPPRSVRGVLRYLGPGIILTGSIVGSGELIVTTRLGAQVGFTLLWLILLSCVIKVFLQIELGRFVISSGQTTLEAFNRVPGPRLGVSWLVWCWLLVQACILVQLSGILYAVSDIFVLFSSDRARWAWTLGIAGLTAGLLASGRYRGVEWATTAMVFVFTVTTLAAVGALQFTAQYGISSADLLEGLSFRLPGGDERVAILTAAAMFGITGVGASELVWYPYWCLEKGYARFAGPNAPGEDWAARARGWVRVMRVDAWTSMVIYTVSTVAFYLLGAAVLNRDYLAGRGAVPGDAGMLETLKAMYTRTLGSTTGSVIFLVGAFAVLYSTIFVSTASHGRLLADAGSILGWVRYRDPGHRRQTVGLLCLVIPAFCFLVQELSPRPLTLILVGGVAQFSMLPLIALGTVYLRYRRTDSRIAPAALSDVFLWISFATMFALGIYKAWDGLSQLLR